MSRHAKNQGPFVRLGAVALAALLSISSLTGSQAASLEGVIDIGSAADFAVIAGTGITNTGVTSITGTGGDIGSYPTRAFTGSGTVTTGGTKYESADAAQETLDALIAAKADLQEAFDIAKALEGADPITSAAVTLTPGLYKTEASFALAGGQVLTLDGEGNPNAIFIFQMFSDLTLALNASVVLAGGAQAKNVFWQVTTTATFEPGTEFVGTVMAGTAITAKSGSEFDGQLLAIDTTVTMDSNTINNNSNSTAQILPSAPARPVLIPASDTGASDSDGVTSKTLPTLSMAGLIVGEEVLVTAANGDLEKTCRFTATSTTQSCVFTDPLTDGTWSLTAANIVDDNSSAESDSLSIRIDTIAPAIETFTVNQASFATSVLTHSLVFTESVAGLEATDFSVVTDGVSCEEPTLSGSGANYTISLANCTGVGDLQLSLAADSAVDLAGNTGPGAAFLTAIATKDETAPTVLFVSSSAANGLLTQGEQLEIQVRFSEPITVSGIPKITLETGTTDRVASYVSGSGTTTLVFDYTVQPGDSSANLDYVASDSLTLGGGTVSDEAGNAALLALPAPGATGSLGENKTFVVDGSVIRLEILPVSPTSDDKNVSWSVTALVALNCHAFSEVAGVDFDFTGLSPLTITSSNGDKTCTISGTSVIGPAQYGVSSLSLASTFSFTNAAFEPHTVVSGTETDILVDILPDQDNQGGVIQTPGFGTTADEYLHELGHGLLDGAGVADVAALLGLGMVNAVDAAPTESISVDHFGVTGELKSMSRHEVRAGDSISLQLEVSDLVAQDHSLAAYVETGDDWTFAGLTAFETSVASTNAFTLTLPGTYFIRLYVIPPEPTLVAQSQISGPGGFSNLFAPVVSTMSVLESELPDVNQSHQAEIIVTGTAETIDPSQSGEGSAPEDSGSSPEITQEPVPEVTDEPNPGVTEEPVPEVSEKPTPVVTEEPAPEVPEEPTQASPGAGTDTGGQLPDTGNPNWVLPLGIGGGIAMLGVAIFLSRRRLV